MCDGLLTVVVGGFAFGGICVVLSFVRWVFIPITFNRF